MQENNQTIDELIVRLDKLIEVIKLPEKKKKIEELEAKAAESSLWSDPTNARTVTQELSDLKKEVKEITELSETLEILGELQDEAEVRKAEKTLAKLELMSYLSGEYDAKNAIVSIHAGQGGTEAMDWSNMLYRMYLRFCERRGWPTENLDYTPGEVAGIKSVTLKLQGIMPTDTSKAKRVLTGSLDNLLLMQISLDKLLLLWLRLCRNLRTLILRILISKMRNLTGNLFTPAATAART